MAEIFLAVKNIFHGFVAAAMLIPYGSSALDNLINLGTREMLNYAHSNNIAVQYWTINSEEEVKLLTRNGADCIITDNPETAYAAVHLTE